MDHNSTPDSTLPSTVDDITADCRRSVLLLLPLTSNINGHLPVPIGFAYWCWERSRLSLRENVKRIQSNNHFSIDGVWEVVVNQ
jgi:hypothetical protein